MESEPHRRLLYLKWEKRPKGIQENVNIIGKMGPKRLLYRRDWERGHQLSPYNQKKVGMGRLRITEDSDLCRTVIQGFHH